MLVIFMCHVEVLQFFSKHFWEREMKWPRTKYLNFCDMVCYCFNRTWLWKKVCEHMFLVEVHWGLDRKWCICSAGWGLTWKNSATYIILASKWCRAGNFFGHITPTGTVNHKIDSAGCYIPKNDPQVLQNLFLVTQFKQSTQSPQNTYLEKKH